MSWNRRYPSLAVKSKALLDKEEKVLT